MRLRTALVAMAATSSIRAQSTHRIAGGVYDSISRRPLAGAIIQAVGVDSMSSSQSHSFTASADSAGRYVLTGLPSGRFAIGFQHDALNALGIESPIKAVVLDRDTSIVVDLAIPSGPSVRATACGTGDSAHGGMLAGYVLDARTGAVLKTAVVLVQWLELDFAGGKLQSGPHRVSATVGEDGAYKACGIPSEEPVIVTASSSGFHSVKTELALPAGGVERHDFHLADAALAHGSAAIALHVIDDSGAVVLSGRVALPELARETAMTNGAAIVDGLPPGTWAVVLRSFGFQPKRW